MRKILSLTSSKGMHFLHLAKALPIAIFCNIVIQRERTILMCSISLTKVFFSSTSLRMAAEKWNVFPLLSKLTKLDFLSSATSSFSLCTSSSPPQFVFLLGLRLVFVMFHILTFLPMTSSHSFLALISLFSLENATIIKSFLFAL